MMDHNHNDSDDQERQMTALFCFFCLLATSTPIPLHSCPMRLHAEQNIHMRMSACLLHFYASFSKDCQSHETKGAGSRPDDWSTGRIGRRHPSLGKPSCIVLRQWRCAPVPAESEIRPAPESQSAAGSLRFTGQKEKETTKRKKM